MYSVPMEYLYRTCQVVYIKFGLHEYSLKQDSYGEVVLQNFVHSSLRRLLIPANWSGGVHDAASLNYSRFGISSRQRSIRFSHIDPAAYFHADRGVHFFRNTSF